MQNKVAGMWGRWLIIVALLFPATGAFAQHQALLVGVSNYPQLSGDRRLKGPPNDLRLMRQSLLDSGFDGKRIDILADDREMAEKLPTKSNILAAFSRILREARPGEWVMLFLTGHGAQQPQKWPLAEGSYAEPDGLDEIFLPSDVGKWSATNFAVENALRDDEIRGWIEALSNKGVRVWATFDTCHAGGMSKGAFDRNRRDLDRFVTFGALGIPDEAVARARERAKNTLTSTKPRPLPKGVVLFHASQKDEPSSEEPLPVPAFLRSLGRSDEKAYFGLFTYHLAGSLRESRGTFEQLAARISEKFSSRPFPTPLFEGDLKLHVDFSKK